ncbi:MAG: hypothetical protein MK101_08155 [Phycisphaerales bacterium]|nr:hypothetical protein [Phycisphaerales bacterium]
MTASPITADTTSTTLDLDAALAAIETTHGSDGLDRARAGVARVAQMWTVDDGDQAAFAEFCSDYFIADEAGLATLVDRLEVALEQVGGHLYEMRRTLRRWSDLRGEPFGKVDDLLATFDPAPDLSDQYWRQKIAFVARLNLDRPDLETMIAEGEGWTSDDWAAVRVSRAFGPRVPAEVSDLVRNLSFKSGKFVSEFHVPVGNLVDATGERWFEADRALIAHWLIREEIRAAYAVDGGVTRQRALMWVMRRHIDGTIPRSIMDRTAEGDWDAQANTIAGEACTDVIGPVRYEHWCDNITAARALDEHHDEHPTAMRRKFDREREIPEEEVVRQLELLLEAPARAGIAQLMRQRLGRDLEPQDIYFDELAEPTDASMLDAAVKERFGDHRGLELALPQVLEQLGWSRGDAEFLGRRVRVEIARGAGHAMRPALPEYGAWLRTNSLDHELGWDGFDTAMHELGHNLEQLCSTHFVPRPALRGVPNTACTEAFAFLYQGLAGTVLQLPEGDEEVAADMACCERLLEAAQIAGPALLEIHVWRWIYDNPDADADAIRDTVLRVADELWTRYYAEHFGPDPYAILGAYQHMVGYPLYLADYALGHIISHQIIQHMVGKDLASETRRICSIGSLTPDAWMRIAVGRGIDAGVLASDAAAAVDRLTRTGMGGA